MKLLLDQGTPRSTSALLRKAGIDAVHTAEIRMAEADDEEILRSASADNLTIVTLDADFHALLALSSARKPSVIRIRIEGLNAEALSLLIQNVIEQCAGDLNKGAIVSVREHQIRVRRLPIS
jgi:predicted nuclease of predicted toxin-antitoxin system